MEGVRAAILLDLFLNQVRIRQALFDLAKQMPGLINTPPSFRDHLTHR
jgi:hypothetical protein